MMRRDLKYYLWWNEISTITRTGKNINDIREINPKIFECQRNRNTIDLYQKIVVKRPSWMSNESDPFYMATRTTPLTRSDNDLWLIRQRVGCKQLASIVKTMKEQGKLDTNKRLTNHSARKYLVQKLKDNNILDSDTTQITGHSSMGEGNHIEISGVLSN